MDPYMPQMQQHQRQEQHLPTEDCGAEEITAPLVFQCIKCRLIVGDSFAWVNADKDLRSVALHAKPANIRVGTEVEWSRGGIDLGSTYVLTYCHGCGNVLGKVYHTTPRKFDYIRDLIMIDLDQVTTYQLGQYLNDGAIPADLISMPNARMLQLSVDMVKDVLLVMHDRLSNMEHKLGQSSSMGPESELRDLGL
ncbi:323_t:CDS:2 [Paraglomus occultum]|uniref:323_t:CDS:1 n=1 Tax=Paraglomus occultum TaxID=144539 RepID=A0A9N9BZG7_9GLOM|nr:323_t:CDS:2 [Paraglomus occultum]